MISYEEEEETEDGFYFVKILVDNDRLVFGTSTTFIVKIPNDNHEISELKIEN